LRATLMPPSGAVRQIEITPVQASKAAVADNVLQDKVVRYLTGLIASSLKLAHVDSRAPLENYGINSVMAVDLTNALELTFGSLPKTLFYEYQSIATLAEYFLQNHKTQLTGLLGLEEGTRPAPEPTPAPAAEGRKVKRQRFAMVSEPLKPTGALDVAIIGIS